jgi:hypothetical protein
VHDRCCFFFLQRGLRWTTKLADHVTTATLTANGSKRQVRPGQGQAWNCVGFLQAGSAGGPSTIYRFERNDPHADVFLGVTAFGARLDLPPPRRGEWSSICCNKSVAIQDAHQTMPLSLLPKRPAQGFPTTRAFERCHSAAPTVAAMLSTKHCNSVGQRRTSEPSGFPHSADIPVSRPMPVATIALHQGCYARYGRRIA